MKRATPLLALFSAAALAVSASASTPTEAEVKANLDARAECRASALEVAGAFTNDGFKIRDGHFFNTIAPNSPSLVQVNLYAGNQYWFVAAATEPAKKLTISLYDEAGKPVAYEPYTDEGKAAAGFAPTISGPYYVLVQEESGSEATFCLIYCYK